MGRAEDRVTGCTRRPTGAGSLTAPAASLALLLLLAACSGGGTPQEHVHLPPVAGPALVDPLVAEPPPGVAPLPPENERRPAPIAAEGEGAGAATGQWWFAELSDDGRQIHFWYRSQPTCEYELLGVHVTETADHVEIAPLRSYAPLPEGTVCPLDLRPTESAYVTLEQPLGTRHLLHPPHSDGSRPST